VCAVLIQAGCAQMAFSVSMCVSVTEPPRLKVVTVMATLKLYKLTIHCEG